MTFYNRENLIYFTNMTILINFITLYFFFPNNSQHDFQLKQSQGFNANLIGINYI